MRLSVIWTLKTITGQTQIAGKEFASLAGSACPTANEPQVSFPRESHAFLLDISRRIESIEMNLDPLQSTLKAHLDQLTALQNAFKSYMDKTDGQLADINKRHEKTSADR